MTHHARRRGYVDPGEHDSPLRTALAILGWIVVAVALTAVGP